MRPLLFAVMLLCAVPSWAETAARQDAPEQTVTPKPPAPRPYEMPAGATLRRGQKPPEGLTPTEKQISSPTDEVDASDALDEMIDELASDLARLGSGHFAPILLERVRLSDNFNPQFAAILEARLATAIFQATSSPLLRCVECWATRGRVENATWIVTRGITTREEMQALAKKYGARTFLSVSLTLYSAPNSMALDVELVRAEDNSIAFAESYRIHPYTALVYRAADRHQSREAKLKDLQDRIDARPVFGHGAVFGPMMLPSTSVQGNIYGAYGAYRLYEKFGESRQWRFGVQAGGFLHTSRLAGAIVGLSLTRRLFDENVFEPSLHVGGSVGGFLTGGGGNTPILTVQAEYLLVHRLALQASLSYVIPFQLGGGTETVGGLSPQGGVAFVW